MPRHMRLHPKGKSSTMQKPCDNEKDTTEDSGSGSDEAARKFQLELCWCIQQLEASIKEKKVNEKQLQETWKVLTVLKNNNQPVIRKRQLMRTHFGDYRAKMAAEEKKLSKLPSKFKIINSTQQIKATFLRKSFFSKTGDEAFKFNFSINDDEVDNDKSLANTETEPNQPENEPPKQIDEHAVDKAKDFKFTFSNSQFKFNFDIQDKK